MGERERRGGAVKMAPSCFRHSSSYSSQNDEARIHRPRGSVRRLIRGRREAPEASRELQKVASAREAHRATSTHIARSTHIPLPSSPVPPLAAQKYNTAAKRVEGKLNVHIVREYARAVDSTAGCGEVHFNFCLKREPKDPYYSLPPPTPAAHTHDDVGWLKTVRSSVRSEGGVRPVRTLPSVPPTPFPSHRTTPPFPPSLTLFPLPPPLQVDEYYYGNRCAASFWHMQRCEALPPSNSLPPSPSPLSAATTSSAPRCRTLLAPSSRSSSGTRTASSSVSSRGTQDTFPRALSPHEQTQLIWFHSHPHSSTFPSSRRRRAGLLPALLGRGRRQDPGPDPEARPERPARVHQRRLV
jgi:hypothetical protein